MGSAQTHHNFTAISLLLYTIRERDSGVKIMVFELHIVGRKFNSSTDAVELKK